MKETELLQNKTSYFGFIQKCQIMKELPVPILQKLKDKWLLLENYRINEGIAECLEGILFISYYFSWNIWEIRKQN